MTKSSCFARVLGGKDGKLAQVGRIHVPVSVSCYLGPQGIKDVASRYDDREI